MIELACSADSRYVPHSAAMLHSVLAHRGADEVRIHYLRSPDVSAEDAQRLSEMVERGGGRISFLDVSAERVTGLPTWEYITEAMWHRIFLPELLPDVDRILYLDVDAIVADALAPLWATELDDCYLAAVTNVFQRDHAHRPRALGLEDPESYFNSGVLLLNLDLMRNDACSAALRDYALAHASELMWPDQDALNVVLGGRRRALHPRWNCMNSFWAFPWSAEVFGPDALAEAKRRPGIRHFEGPTVNKPWHYMFAWEGRELYIEHRERTPWPAYRLEGRTPANVLRRLARVAAD